MSSDKTLDRCLLSLDLYSIEPFILKYNGPFDILGRGLVFFPRFKLYFLSVFAKIIFSKVTWNKLFISLKKEHIKIRKI